MYISRPGIQDVSLHLPLPPLSPSLAGKCWVQSSSWRDSQAQPFDGGSQGIW